jgi:hypothetical protein
MDGCLVMLLGQAVPHESGFVATEEEMRRWNAAREQFKARARNAMSVSEALAVATGNAQAALRPDQFIVPMATPLSPGWSLSGKLPGGM